MANPPGVNVTVNAPSSSPLNNAPTGTWFVTGLTAGGPSGIAVPVTSLQTFNQYFGTVVSGVVQNRTGQSGSNSPAALYDALDVYFREGGIVAYVSNVVGATSVGASGVIRDASSGAVATLTAVGGGTWANSASGSIGGIIVTVATVGAGFTVTVNYNGNLLATSPTLFNGNDIKNWVSSLPTPGVLLSVTVGASTTGPTGATTYLAGGTDVAAVESDWTNALTAFTPILGVGQVSAPGHSGSSGAGYTAVVNHALANNRVAVLDAPDTATAATAITNGGYVQTGTNAATDPSYGSMFGPWLVAPGIGTSTPASVAPVFTRTVAPSALAAANMANSDTKNDCNVSAAGLQNGNANYVTDVTQTYSASDRTLLNNAGVNVIRNINGTVAIYGYRSLALDSNWAGLNHVRFRMQILRDLDIIAEPFVFAEIDGKGQIFSRLGGAISGQCQLYWLRNSLYGNSVNDAFTVNVGPQINTPTTIAAGQINAQVNLRMSPQAELVSIVVTKYLASATLPSY